MAASDITVAALTAAPTLRGNRLAWTYSDPRLGALPNIALDMVEVHASTTNDRAGATKVGEGITDFLHAGLLEEQTYYYWIKARDYLGGFGPWYPSGATSGVAATAISASALAFGIANGRFVVDTNATDASVAANAVKFSIKTAAGADPSGSDPVYISFPDLSGAYTPRRLTAACSVTLSPGSTCGTVSLVPFRLWGELLDDAGTLRLGVSNRSDGLGAVYPLRDGQIASSTAEGGAGSADNVATIYTTVAVTAKPYRIIGSADWNAGLTTAGIWSSGPDSTKLYSLGAAKPGDVLQDIPAVLTSVVTGTVVVPYDDTKPLITGESTSITTITILPNSKINILESEFHGNMSCTVAGPIMVSIDKGGTNVLAVGWGDVRAADAPTQVRTFDRRQFNTASSLLIDFRMAPANAGTITINGINGARKFGGTLQSFARLREIVG